MSTNRLFIYDEKTNLAACVAKGYSSGWSCHGSTQHMEDFFELVQELTGCLSKENPTRLKLMTEDNLPGGCAVFYSRKSNDAMELLDEDKPMTATECLESVEKLNQKTAADGFNQVDARSIVYKLLNKKLDEALASVMNHGTGYLLVDSNGVKNIPIADVKLNKEREIMTPNDIEVLIHCHVSPEPHPRLGTNGVNSTIQSLLINGLIERRIPGVYTTTNKGKAHIEQLCSTAWPTEKWVSESGNIIDYMGEK